MVVNKFKALCQSLPIYLISATSAFNQDNKIIMKEGEGENPPPLAGIPAL
jgi:hypothetical protein